MRLLVVVVLLLETMPLGILAGTVRDDSRRRRPRFWARSAGLAICVPLPELVLIAGLAVGLIGEQALAGLLWGGFAWGLGLAAVSPLVLFRGPTSAPGGSDAGENGPDPPDDRPPAPRPIGGIPLPDAEQSSIRIRGPHSRPGIAHRPKPAHEPRRRPSRVTRRREAI
jgi:hypothetical protein